MTICRPLNSNSETDIARKEFKGWLEADRDARLMEFVSLVQTSSQPWRSRLARAFGKIDDPVYGFEKPYVFAYIAACSGSQGNPSRENIEIIFDNDVVHRGQAKAAYK